MLKRATVITSEGRMKLLGPKISRQTMAETKASHAGRRLSAPSICSIRITMKRAVSAKSMPVVLKGSMLPISAPIMLRIIQ